MAAREFDLILWGATGFTGGLVAEYLAGAYGNGLRWAIAGRNAGKLEAVRAALAPALRDTLPLVLADSADADSLRALAARTRVVCTTVGPYAKYGTPLVAACAAAGTDYCDLTGESQWMARVIAAHQAQAQASGARIVHTCGFDSVPFDMGVWQLQQVAKQRHGAYLPVVKGRMVSFRGGASGGTIASMMAMLEEAAADPAVRRLVADPYALYPPGVPRGDAGPDQRGAVFDPDFGQWTSPFIMAAINTRVVRRSNALLGLPWGVNFRYDEAVLNRSRGQALMASAATGAGMVTMALGPLRRVAQRFLPTPGEGPDRAQREAGHYDILFLGLDPADRSRDTWLRVGGDLDPGYGSTARMLGEAAVCLASDPRGVEGGFWTPATALGAPYLERLRTRAGLRFEVVDGPGN